MTGTYDHRLVALSIAIAIAASYSALDLAGRVRMHQSAARWFWITGGGSAMGVGIWAMHYVGMLAFRLPVPVLYHVPTVLLSLLAAVLASQIALFTVSQEQLRPWQFISGSLIMGGGISAVHYVGMEAMRLPAMMHFRPGMVVLSVVIAVAIAGVALGLSSRVQNQQKATLQKIGSALLMGLAIPAMHYSAMYAAVFVPKDGAVDAVHAARISSLGVVAITGASLLVLALVISAAFVDRLLAAEKAIGAAVQAGETNFRNLTEAIPQIIWIARPDAHVEFFNRRWFEYTGLNAKQSRGLIWETVVHPDDLSACLDKWRKSQPAGEYQVEYRLRRADGSYRWHLGRALAVRDETRQVTRWLGSCTDIDDQKKTERALEQEVALRTSALQAANLKLTEEMGQREHAQRELNKQTDLLVRALSERARKNTLLAKMGELLQNCSHMKEAFPVVASFAPKLFPDIRGALLLTNPTQKILEVAVHWSNCQLDDLVFSVDSCWAIRTGRRYEAGTPGSILCAHAAHLAAPYLCIPVHAQGEAAGIMHFQLSREHALPDVEIALLESFAEQVALSLANIRLREELRAQSIRDPLSGLFNRRYLEETVQRELARVLRGKRELGVVMLDIDHFKRFNDTFGHDAGDAILRELGRFLLLNIRGDDIPCRFGGEEFVLVLPGAGIDATRLRAEDLRSKIMALNVVSQGKVLGTITVSSGVGCFPLHGSDWPKLLTAVDAALYTAKRNGRNQVVVAAAPPAHSIALSSPLVTA